MKTQASFDPKRELYLMQDPRLEAAIELALDLGMPLLLTGEPGTGKTQLAHYVAREVIKSGKPLIFNTKTGSKAKDLLYKYNALTHFRDSQQGKEELNPMDYMSFQALGKAIVNSSHERHVVLLDEIDKAPRDFPNDVLFEFEEMAFRVEEATIEAAQSWGRKQEKPVEVDDQGYIRFGGKASERPFLVITSNSEKNLPEPFLRRCVYYHIPFPKKEALLAIIQQKVPLSDAFITGMLPNAIDYFEELRNKGLRKSPATAELLAWVHHLNKHEIDVALSRKKGAEAALKESLIRSYSALLKNKEDRRRMIDELNRRA